MFETVQQFLTGVGYHELPVASQIVAATSAVYTVYRTVVHGLPAAWRGTKRAVQATVAWMRRPSRVELLRKEIEELRRAIL